MTYRFHAALVLAMVIILANNPRTRAFTISVMKHIHFLYYVEYYDAPFFTYLFHFRLLFIISADSSVG